MGFNFLETDRSKEEISWLIFNFFSEKKEEEENKTTINSRFIKKKLFF